MEHLDHFGLKRDPFCNHSQLSFYFAEGPVGAAEARLSRAVHQAKGLALLIGPMGAGKTMLLRHLLEELDEERFEASLLMAVHEVEPGWLLARVARELGAESEAHEGPALLAALFERLIELRVEGRHGVVLIDDAQLLAHPSCLAELRALLNLESDEERLLSLVVAGLPELEEAVRAMPSLAERVEVCVRLRGYDPETAHAYLAHRLERAGGSLDLFDPAALDRIAKLSGGLPRRLNTLADNALFEAYLTGARRVEADAVERAAAETLWLVGRAPSDAGSGATPVPESPRPAVPRAPLGERSAPAPEAGVPPTAKAEPDAVATPAEESEPEAVAEPGPEVLPDEDELDEVFLRLGREG